MKGVSRALRRRSWVFIRRWWLRLWHPTWYYSWPTPFVLWRDAWKDTADERRADAVYLWPNGLRWWFLGFALFFVFSVIFSLGPSLPNSDSSPPTSGSNSPNSDSSAPNSGSSSPCSDSSPSTSGSNSPSLWYSFGISLAVLVWMVWLYPFLVFYVWRREVLADLWGTWPPQMEKLYGQAPSLVTKPSQQGPVGTLLSTLLSRTLEGVTKFSKQHPVTTLLSTLLGRALEWITKPGKWHLFDTVLFALLPFDTLLSTLPSRIRALLSTLLSRALEGITKFGKQHPVTTLLSTLLGRALEWITKPGKQRPSGTMLLYGRKYRPAASDESVQAVLERAALAEHFTSKSSPAGIWCDRGFRRWLITRCGPVVAGQGVMFILVVCALSSGNKGAVLPILVWTVLAVGFLWRAACAFDRECHVSLSPEDLSRCLPYLGLTLVHTSLQRTRPQLTVPLVVTVVGLNLTFAISLFGAIK